jgi:integrase
MNAEKSLNIYAIEGKFINYLKSEKASANTIKNYSSTIGAFKTFLMSMELNLNSIPANDLKNLIFDFMESFQSYTKQGKNNDIELKYKRTSLSAKRSCLRTFVKYLKSRDYIDEDFSSYIKTIKNSQGSTGKRALTLEELKQINEYLIKTVDEAIGYDQYLAVRNRFLFCLLLYTGTRISEIVRLKWDDIDMYKDEIVVVSGKRMKTRSIPFTKDVKLSIHEFKSFVRDEVNMAYEKGAVCRNVVSDYVFPTEHMNQKTKMRANKPMTARNGQLIIDKIIKNALPEYAKFIEDLKKSEDEKDRERLGQRKITAHTIRHTWASHAIYAGIPVTTVSSILGHSTPKITMDVYAHEISEHDKREAVEKLNFGF